MNEQILKYLQTIPKGKVTTYKNIAKIFGVHPRKVAQVMRYNKFPDIYPCYKVIASDGEISGYSGEGGVKEKIERLRKDGVEVRDGKVSEEFIV